MKKLASNLPLQDMIRNVVENAHQKLASSEAFKDEQVQRLLDQEGYYEENTQYEKVASTNSFIEKLASAVDYIAENVDQISIDRAGVIESAISKMAEGGSPAGPGRGPGALQTMQVNPPKQSHKKDKSRGHDAAVSTAGTALSTGGLPGGATQMQNDMHRTDPSYPEKGVLKTAFSVTDRGHKLDAERANAFSKSHHESAKSRRDYSDDNPLGGQLTGHATAGLGDRVRARHLDYVAKKHEDRRNAFNPFGGMATKSRHEVADKKEKTAFSVTERGHKLDAERLNAFSKAHHESAKSRRDYSDDNPIGGQLTGHAAGGLGDRIQARHLDYAAKKHEDRRNAFNPFGGMLTKSRHEVDDKKGKTKKASDAAKELILRKLAGEDVMKANITSARSANPLAGMGQLASAQTGETMPSASGGAGSGGGNSGRRLIQSNGSAIGYSKGDAKGPQKTQLQQLLSEPALSPRTDTTLKQNLRNTGNAGVKIAAVATALQKIAQKGCQCESNGECSYCRLDTAVRANKSEKTANAMMGGMSSMGGSAGMGGMSSMGGGMSSMANAGAGADGCSCGGTGECRVCKLKAALAAAKAPQEGQAVEKDSTGDTSPPSGMY